MRTPTRALILTLAAGCAAPLVRAQSVSIEMLDHYSQTSVASPVETGLPFSFEVHLRANGAVSMTNWGPTYTLPGGTTPSGVASNTNTGTQNFSASPNDGADFFFQANYSSATTMSANFPTMGTYHIVLTGGGAPSPSTFDSGLTFSSGTFASVAPKVTGVNNGATWSSGLLVSTTGTTTLTINSGSFSEYTTGTASQIQARLQDQSGTTLAFSQTNYSTALGYSDSAMTQFAINGSLLTPGNTYTLSFQYGILASTPGSSLLGVTSFTGLAEYFSNTSITITAVPEPTAFAALAGAAALLGTGLYRWPRKRRTASP